MDHICPCVGLSISRQPPLFISRFSRHYFLCNMPPVGPDQFLIPEEGFLTDSFISVCIIHIDETISFIHHPDDNCADRSVAPPAWRRSDCPDRSHAPESPPARSPPEYDTPPAPSSAHQSGSDRKSTRDSALPH